MTSAGALRAWARVSELWLVSLLIGAATGGLSVQVG